MLYIIGSAVVKNFTMPKNVRNILGEQILKGGTDMRGEERKPEIIKDRFY